MKKYNMGSFIDMTGWKMWERGFIWKYVENQNIDIGDVNEESIKG
jgi:hypothetical protein